MTTETAEQIIERRVAEDELLRAHFRARDAEARRRRAEYHASLPQVQYEPEPVIEQGQQYVLSDRRLMAFNGATAFVASVPGRWHTAEYAERIGLTGAPQVLRWRPTSS